MLIAAVIPCYRVRGAILSVIATIPEEVDQIFVVDDCCPEKTGNHVEALCTDPRVTILRHEQNGGVGAAMITGYRAAIAAGADIAVKIDGDGQMDPALLPYFVAPIRNGFADYTKGNRFHNVEDMKSMPITRLIGNMALSFMTKLSSGYWTIFDPTNGYTAIHTAVLSRLPLDKIEKRYFFESDLLFRLGTIRSHVLDIPMAARYADEISGLVPWRMVLPFLRGHLRNTAKRYVYTYFLRDFSLASLQSVIGTFLLAFGGLFGIAAWHRSTMTGIPATAGTVILAALPVLLGIQFLLSFFAYDIALTPRQAIHSLIARRP